jgi:hypothetical protein
MKFTNPIVYFCLIIITFSCNNNTNNSINSVPAYKLIQDFSKRIKPGTGLVLCSYGINNHLPKDYSYQNEVATFSVAYSLYKTQKDTISLEHARETAISLTESLLQEINSNPDIRNYLEIYPFTADRIDVTVRFKDEKKIELGTGVSVVYYWNGKLEYERYEIHEYTGHYPAKGEHFTIHKETYAEALDIVKQQGALVYFQ